jgi:hypothetical protein
VLAIVIALTRLAIGTLNKWLKVAVSYQQLLEADLQMVPLQPKFKSLYLG